MCHNFNGGTTLNKTSNNYSNDTYNITKNNNFFNTTDNQCFTKLIIQVISLMLLQSSLTIIMKIVL